MTTWEAAGSLREVKDLLGVLDPKEALRRVTSAPVYRFRYKAGARPTTGDYQTEYAGPVADEAPWIVHHGGRIFNPVSGVGHALAAIQALAAEVAELRQQLADLRKPTKRSA